MTQEAKNFVVLSDNDAGQYFTLESDARTWAGHEIHTIIQDAHRGVFDGVDADSVASITVARVIARGGCDNPDMAYQIHEFSLHEVPAPSAREQALEKALRALVQGLTELNEQQVGVGQGLILAARAALE